MKIDFRKYLKQVALTDDPEDLKALTSGTLASYGFGMFSYISFNPPLNKKGSTVNTSFLQTTYPKKWIDTYVKNSFFYLDPIILDAKSSLLPFIWDGPERAEAGPAQLKKFFRQAAKFGISRGAVIPIHAPGGEFAIMALVFNGSNSALQKVWEYYKNELHLLGIHYHVAVWENILKRKTGPTPKLSPRELQCLQWAARGKTLWETAQIMGISEETAKTYLKSVMRKLETNNKTHAVSKALLHGLITV